MLNSGTSRRKQAGFSLLEGLVAILVFSLGAIGAIEMQARAVQFGSEARDRATAAFLINKLIAQVELQDATSGDPSSEFLLDRTECPASLGTHPAAAWVLEACENFPEASVTIARPSGVTTGFLTITLEWSAEFKQPDGAGGAVRDSHSMSVTNRFQWQS
ncbi:MAG TPA: prepilin-type N-terminal cleavage/methylation domain-containing protein [Aromatoleum sp.]|uniref:type IV pilus modification PilV family protein n=1 Tax=Aromatoleum sp. TaxID=2307007 RepID=UPI002B45AA9C|nr:prepilin-type N-terminal cleavage/methylation domain-containing protein [Aromatoleum sp.]HJV27136.1 prepilin-type N-terminal cleavage/methylation domain-containing protein [Aromatoleum sp.]